MANYKINSVVQLPSMNMYVYTSLINSITLVFDITKYYFAETQFDKNIDQRRVYVYVCVRYVYVYVCVCVCVCVCARMRARVRACACACLCA